VTEPRWAGIAEALDEMRAGRLILVVDDEDRENEGDIILAAEHVTPWAINFMATFGRGLICMPMLGERLDELELPLMVPAHNGTMHTAFTVSVDAACCGTGISAADRALTVAALIDPATQPTDLIAPGHLFPLRSAPGGVTQRRGHTEAAVDLVRLAGCYPAAVICEVMNEDGTMARRQDLLLFADRHHMPAITIAQLVDEVVKRDS
jgi:3,4-dihydroxy 2-butanone 4-phosphate synthase/GTP cyclohydrolase II